MTTIAIVGSRSFNDYEFLKKEVDKITYDITDEIKIISGGARGADSLAEKYANERNLKVEVIKPDWQKYGKIAGMLRNSDIIVCADIVIAFWDGKSPGTKDSINKAKKLNKKVIVINF